MIVHTAFGGDDMKLARLTCPGCRNPYETAVLSAAHFAQCPNCGQHNNVPPLPVITGTCLNCGKALDDHIWQGDIAVHCP